MVLFCLSQYTYHIGRASFAVSELLASLSLRQGGRQDALDEGSDSDTSSISSSGSGVSRDSFLRNANDCDSSTDSESEEGKPNSNIPSNSATHNRRKSTKLANNTAPNTPYNSTKVKATISSSFKNIFRKESQVVPLSETTPLCEDDLLSIASSENNSEQSTVDSPDKNIPDDSLIFSDDSSTHHDSSPVRLLGASMEGNDEVMKLDTVESVCSIHSSGGSSGCDSDGRNGCSGRCEQVQPEILLAVPTSQREGNNIRNLDDNNDMTAIDTPDEVQFVANIYDEFNGTVIGTAVIKVRPC